MKFKKTELSLLKEGYFKLLRVEDNFVTVQSKNTDHCWMVFKKTYDMERPVVLYHKHSISDEWFHEHKRGWTVAEMVKEIKRHDKYVLEHPDYLLWKRSGRRAAYRPFMVASR